MPEAEVPVTTEPIPPPRTPPTLGSRIGDGVEVIAAAAAGSVATPLLLSVAGFAPQRILESAGTLCLFLAVEATLTLLLMFGLLRWRGENLRAIGWAAGRWTAEVRSGLLWVPLLFLATFANGVLFRWLLPDLVTAENPMLALVREWTDLLLLGLSAVYVGGLKEEVQRAFVLHRFRDLGGPWVGLAVWSIIFGAGHSVQGVDNAVAAGILGLLFGILYLRRGSLTGPITAHAAYNLLTLAVYWAFVS